MKKYLTTFVIGVALLSGTGAYAENSSAQTILELSKQIQPSGKVVNISSSVSWPEVCNYGNEKICNANCDLLKLRYGYSNSHCYHCGTLEFYCKLWN